MNKKKRYGKNKVKFYYLDKNEKTAKKIIFLKKQKLNLKLFYLHDFAL